MSRQGWRRNIGVDPPIPGEMAPRRGAIDAGCRACAISFRGKRASAAERGRAIQWHDAQRDDGIVARPVGRVDESTAQDFSTGLDGGVDKAAGTPSRTLVVDLSGLDYMSSRGLRCLTLAKRKADGAGVTITLAAPNAVMREILAISRYDKIFKVSDSVDAAL